MNKQPKWDWRAYLTDAERENLAVADAAKAEWQRLNRARAQITNRAIQRAKYAARTKKVGEVLDMLADLELDPEKLDAECQKWES